MTEAASQRPSDAHELHRLVEGVELAVVTATTAEMASVLAGVTEAGAITVTGKPWWLGHVPGAGRTVPCALLVSGYGEVNAAHAVTCLLQAVRPRLVLQVGVAGAFVGAGLEPGDLAVASSDSYADLGVVTPDGWLSAETFSEPLAVTADGRELRNTLPLDPDLVDVAARVLRAAAWPAAPPRVTVGPFVTSDQVTGSRAHADVLEARWHAVAESMEGAAAAHVCALYGVPFLQVRGISNLVVDRDRASWRVEDAAAAAGRATLLLVGALDRVLSARVAGRGAGGEESP
ncbi:MAG: futalosine hydrolase [Thermoleophilia bacterium]